MPKITVTDVAVAAGVSRATADRVLNRRGGVSTERQSAVLLAARELGLDRNLEAIPTKMLRVCVLMKPPDNPFYDLLAQGFREANLLYASQSIVSYIQHIDVLSPKDVEDRLLKISENYDALVVVAPSAHGTLEALQSLNKRMPVITLSTDLPIGRSHYYVGPDNYRAGRLAGELMGRLLGRSGGDVLLLAGLSEFRGHRERVEGFREILSDEFPACRIVKEVETFDNSALAVEAVEDALLNLSSLHGIYNVSQANSAIAVKRGELGLLNGVIFICHDLTETTATLLRNGDVHVVIDQDPRLEAQLAMETVLRHFGRKDGTPAPNSMPIQIYFKESLNSEAL